MRLGDSHTYHDTVQELADILNQRDINIQRIERSSETRSKSNQLQRQTAPTNFFIYSWKVSYITPTFLERFAT